MWLSRVVLEVFTCFQSALSQCANVDNPMLTDVKQSMSIGENVLNYVCVQQIEGKKLSIVLDSPMLATY